MVSEENIYLVWFQRNRFILFGFRRIDLFGSVSEHIDLFGLVSEEIDLFGVVSEE